MLVWNVGSSCFGPSSGITSVYLAPGYLILLISVSGILVPHTVFRDAHIPHLTHPGSSPDALKFPPGGASPSLGAFAVTIFDHWRQHPHECASDVMALGHTEWC